MAAPREHRSGEAIPLRPFGCPVLPDIVGPETPAGHVRHALAMVLFAEARLRELGIADPEAVDLLEAARGRLWNVVNELEAVPRPALPGWWWRLRRLADRVGWAHAAAELPDDAAIADAPRPITLYGTPGDPFGFD